MGTFINLTGNALIHSNSGGIWVWKKQLGADLKNSPDTFPTKVYRA